MSSQFAILRTAMLLAPHLATYTYACPHMIPAVSVSGVAHNMPKKVVPPIRQPTQPPARVAVRKAARSVRVPEFVPPEYGAPPSLLVRGDDDAWRSMASVTPDIIDNGELSDARLEQRTTAEGGVEWQVEAPITFAYRVREEVDLLDPASDALIYGHLTDHHELARAKARQPKRVVVVDEAVFALNGERIKAYFAHHNVNMKLMVLPTTEENKDMDMVLQIAEAVHELGIDRRLDPVIAIGGGVCMDIVGFAASIYRRRTPYIRVPTTLMGYVDASVGAKSGVNFSGKKNKLGAYMPPALTLLDRSFLATLDQRQLSNGAAEIAKMALVKDPELFELLATHGSELITNRFQDAAPSDDESTQQHSAASRVLYLSIQTMLEELAPNLWEDSLLRLVDFGHVFSMELEMHALFNQKLFHGEAVAIDMAYSSCLSYVRGHIDEISLERILDMMRGLKLPVYHPAFNAAMVDEAMYERVKFSSGQKMPLPTGEGEARIFDDVTKEELLSALDVWTERCGPK